MTVLRVCYKHGVRFDKDYYVAKHLPLAAAVFGPHGLKGVEMMHVNATADGSAPPYQAIFSAHFASATDLENALKNPRLSEVMADIPHYFDGTPDILIGETVDLPG